MKRLTFESAVTRLLIMLIGIAITIFTSNQALAKEKITVAVVAGFIQTFQEIAAVYEEKTGVKIEVTFSSAGRLYSQIISGAPYDIFLSADREKPDLLFDKELSDKPFVYAVSEVILWSSNNNFCTAGNWRFALRQKGVKKIAIVNPLTGVHGERAKKALQDAALWHVIVEKMVYAPDMAQVFQYATEGAVDAAFCPLALAYTDKGRKGCYYEMKDVPPVVYTACVLKNSKNHKLANNFAAFLTSPEAEIIKKKYGYKQINSEN